MNGSKKKLKGVQKKIILKQGHLASSVNGVCNS